MQKVHTIEMHRVELVLLPERVDRQVAGMHRGVPGDMLSPVRPDTPGTP